MWRELRSGIQGNSKGSKEQGLPCTHAVGPPSERYLLPKDMWTVKRVDKDKE